MCEFCAILDNYKKCRNCSLNYEYTAALVIRSWTKGNKRNAGRITDYRNRGIGYKLNYCPECGRKLEVTK